MNEQVEHLTTGILWTTVNKGQPLPDVYVKHANECPDCREFVLEFSVEARCEGLHFPDLLPQADQCVADLKV
jgi:hypothetical protein